MFVCLCKGVTDQDIHTAVEQGVSSFKAMQKHLAVSTACGSCTCEVKDVIQKKLQKEVSAHASIAREISLPSFA